MDKMLIALLVGMVLFAGCTGSSVLDELGVAPGGTGSNGGLEKSVAPGYGDASGGGGQVVIKTGSARVKVAQNTLEDGYARLKNIVSDMGGDISAVSYNEYTTEKGYYLTLKIDPGKFDQMLGGIKKLGEVKSVDTNLEDVTTQYQDLEVRIRNLREELDALNALYNKTDTIEDILKIRAEINNVETQLEIYEQQKLDLERRAAKSTITVYLYEEKPSIEKDFIVPLGDLAAVFFGALGFAIMAIAAIVGFLLPGLIVLGAIWAAWKLMHRSKRK